MVVDAAGRGFGFRQDAYFPHLNRQKCSLGDVYKPGLTPYTDTVLGAFGVPARAVAVFLAALGACGSFAAPGRFRGACGSLGRVGRRCLLFRVKAACSRMGPNWAEWRASNQPHSEHAYHCLAMCQLDARGEDAYFSHLNGQSGCTGMYRAKRGILEKMPTFLT